MQSCSQCIQQPQPTRKMTYQRYTYQRYTYKNLISLQDDTYSTKHFRVWNKTIWKGHPMRLELTRVGLLVELANHYTTRGAWYWFQVTWIQLQETTSRDYKYPLHLKEGRYCQVCCFMFEAHLKRNADGAQLFLTPPSTVHSYVWLSPLIKLVSHPVQSRKVRWINIVILFN